MNFKKAIAYFTGLMLVWGGIIGIDQNFADVIGPEGGVIGDPTMQGETYEYEEMFFLTGEPVKLTGTVKFPQKPPENATSYSQKYAFTLRNKEKDISLNRSVSFDTVKAVNESMGQTTYKTDIGKLSESITVKGKTYTLGGYLYDGSQLTDNTPAVDYFNGSVYAKKKYFIAGNQIENEGVLIVEMSSDNLVGYKHLWGTSDTRILTYDIKFTRAPSKDTQNQNWSGQVVLKMNGQTRTRLEYLSTDPQTISFRGNYVKRTRDENVLQYTYDLPFWSKDGKQNKSRRNRGEGNLRKDVITDAESLVTAKIRDIGGHWAEKSIKKLTSLEIVSPKDSFFGPDLPINRMDFAQAITKAIADVKPYTRTELIKRDRNKDRKEIFLDIDSKDPQLAYVEFVKKKNLMVGEGDYFMGDRTLRRAEAISILVNALGMSHLAPTPPYKTIYTDDEKIPLWAKDGVYVATEIGLVSPYEDGSLKPLKVVSRAEAVDMLKTFINHIKDNITYDYREKIINRY